MKTNRKARILDVGSGSAPDRRATVICDKYLDDCSHRNRLAIKLNKPFVVADGQFLPFLDKSFDYVICKHVLEHVEDPIALCRELERVADAGYIETPSIIWEKILPYRKNHKWVVFDLDSCLVLNKNPFVDPVACSLYERMLAGSKSISLFRKAYKKLINVHFEWASSINLIVAPPDYDDLLGRWIRKKMAEIDEGSVAADGYREDKDGSCLLWNLMKLRGAIRLVKDIIFIPINCFARRPNRVT